jgi:FtsH-binding integral membrane protein
MNSSLQPTAIQKTESTAIARYMSQVYLMMTLGLGLTAVIAFVLGNRPDISMKIMSTPILFWAIFIFQIALVMILSAALNRLSVFTATLLYFLYSASVGVVFSTLFLIYTKGSLAGVFGVTAFSFAGLSAVGYITKKDLGPIGSFCMMGLWGLIGFYFLSFIFPSLYNQDTSIVSALVGVLIFAGLTAYDTQSIKQEFFIEKDASGQQKAVIHGALRLYLDFINLFLSLLRLMGRRR